ncbi:hypothetical protein L211DRAFT_480604 [Terfezia boudieri ATCC MYA-4762]|uniref:Uncharacterized protein n=1 Tax=Terfezia boudieri ATCC MYA-4762 TaxID=1051890 RepID=A0A3N4LZ09_9PEZI|nr:hypothetical protein L211DRAFT_480604 [Terfezia boudieri ATCC MYA-4762]
MNHTPDHLNYNHPQHPSSTSSDQNQQNQQNYHQLASPITFDDDMLQMQSTSQPMHQFQFGGGNNSVGWPVEEEPQFPQIAMGQQQHLQSYMGNALAGNNINTLDSNSSPNMHSNAVQSNSIPSPPSQPHHDSPVIVNPFTGHGLIPQPSPIHMPSNGVVLHSLAWGSDPSFGNSGFHTALQPPTQQDLQLRANRGGHCR